MLSLELITFIIFLLLEMQVVELEKLLSNQTKYLNNILTSGEAALKSIKEFKYGKKFFHLGPDRDSKLYNGLENHRTTLNNCEYILCTGLYDEHMNDLNFYSKLLINFKDKIENIDSTLPAAPKRCPIEDFVELTNIL